jgi:hypothetical protein
MSFVVRHGDTQGRLAKAIGLSLSRLNAKINEHKAEFRQQEILRIKERYSLTADEVNAIFFEKRVS